MEQNGNPEIDPHVHGQILLDEDAKTTPWRKDCLQQMVLKKRYQHAKNEAGPLNLHHIQKLIKNG